MNTPNWSTATGPLVSPQIDVPNDHLEYSSRSLRFPTREQRMKVYMSSWYLPPLSSTCWTDDALHGRGLLYQWTNSTRRRDIDPSLYASSYDNRTGVLIGQANQSHSSLQMMHFDRYVEEQVAFVVESRTIEGCAKLFDEPPFKRPYPGLLGYCRDVLNTVIPLISTADNEVPLIFQFGINPWSKIHGRLGIPHFRKFRKALPAQAVRAIRTASDESCGSMQRFTLEMSLQTSDERQPILWLLNSLRFRGPLQRLEMLDRPWEEKQDKAVWRGSLTGIRDAHLGKNDTSPLENCLKLPRCRLVYQASTKDSKRTLVDARLTSLDPTGKSGVDRLGMALVGSKMSMRDLLGFKVLIVLEGHELASALLWSLSSQSVVLMAPPKYTSYTMEELLIPFFHYIPLHSDLSNVEEMVQWIHDNDDKAQQIARQGSLFVHDLVFHPDAEEDDLWIRRELVARYSVYFQASL